VSRHGGLETEIKLRLPDALSAIRRRLRLASFHVAKRRMFEANTLSTIRSTRSATRAN